MPESSIHTNLVKLMVRWIIELLPPEDGSHILIDIPENSPQKKPPKLYEFVPDVFVSNSKRYPFIIGEAKTATDIDNNHTMEQITAFLRKCSESDNSLFVLAVPWHRVRLAASVIKYCKKTAGLDLVQTRVIDHLSG
jgi:hypothetical protein